MSETEAARAFDTIARREMGISGDQFLRQLDAGEYKDVDLDALPGLADVWMALPLVR